MTALDFSSSEVVHDGVTVWVNSHKGECLGRFGRMGIDIHVPVEQQLQGVQCLFCTHEPVTRKDWFLFCEKMREFYQVEVSPEMCPTRLRHEHDCDACIYLGTWGEAERDVDLYFCRQGGTNPTVIARRSSEPPNYHSGLGAAQLGHDPALAEALRRAQEKGLVP